MRLTVAFDVDGTLSTSGGPVRIQKLRDLRSVGVKVVIVSPSQARPEGFMEVIDLERSENLRVAARRCPADLYLYVSDNGDRAAAEAAGFTYVEARDFR